jgi:hypothetical protein
MGFAHGSAAPVYIIGGAAKDVITFTFERGTTGFIALQTQCDVKASIKSA